MIKTVRNFNCRTLMKSKREYGHKCLAEDDISVSKFDEISFEKQNEFTISRKIGIT